MHSSPPAIGTRFFRAPLLLGLLLFAGCAAALYIPTVEDASSGATESDLIHGRSLYVQKCGSCHTLRLPENYTAPEWERYLSSMASRTHLTDRERDLIWQYVLAGAHRRRRE